MSNLGIAFQNNGSWPGIQAPTFKIVSRQVIQPVSTEQAAQQLINRILASPKGEKIIKHFANKKPGFHIPILKNKNLNLCQKIERIFGLTMSELFPARQLLGNQLGDVWDDINRIVSEVERTASALSSTLNTLKNKPKEPQFMQQFENVPSPGSVFLTNWGWVLIAALAVLFLFKK